MPVRFKIPFQYLLFEIIRDISPFPPRNPVIHEKKHDLIFVIASEQFTYLFEVYPGIPHTSPALQNFIDVFSQIPDIFLESDFPHGMLLHQSICCSGTDAGQVNDLIYSICLLGSQNPFAVKILLKSLD